MGGVIHKIGSTAAIVTDDNVAPLYADRLEKSLTRGNIRVVRHVIPNGEKSKNAGEFMSLVNFLAKEKLSRTDTVIALGGGVVGDLAGFAAAVYMRGIGFVQIPTTLLAAVDSSVGGKTAINLETGKNLAGAFYQPDLVLCDISLLSTLTPEVFRDGCAEVIKYGIIADNALFDSFETPINTQLENVIARCIEIKRDIVANDEFERGERKLLNFGHTIGHAIELLSGYKTTHGNAVAAGMAIVTRAAARMDICDGLCRQSVLQMLKHYKLPTNTDYDAAALSHACLADKKRDGGKLTMVFPQKIGKCVLNDIKVEGLEKIIQLGLEEN
jgi:3-dehydroquinate synthase